MYLARQAKIRDQGHIIKPTTLQELVGFWYLVSSNYCIVATGSSSWSVVIKYSNSVKFDGPFCQGYHLTILAY